MEFHQDDQVFYSAGQCLRIADLRFLQSSISSHSWGSLWDAVHYSRPNYLWIFSHSPGSPQEIFGTYSYLSIFSCSPETMRDPVLQNVHGMIKHAVFRLRAVPGTRHSSSSRVFESVQLTATSRVSYGALIRCRYPCLRRVPLGELFSKCANCTPLRNF